MMSSTHLISGLCFTSLALGTANPVVLATGAIASLLPDVDTSRSIAGRLLFPISWALEKRFPHRTLTHSFFASFVLGVVTIPVIFVWGYQYWFALNLGYFAGWYLDNFTKAGVCAFWPSDIRMVTPGNYSMRLRTGSLSEYAIALLMAGIFVISFNINSSGGLMRQANILLGQPDSVVQMYREAGDSNLIYAKLSGTYTVSNQAINGETFEVIYPYKDGLLISKPSEEEVYLASSEGEADIVISRVKPRLGSPIEIQIVEVNFEEEEISAKLAQLPRGRAAYISGRLALDDEVVLPISETEFNAIQGSGTTATLEAASPQEVQKILGEYFATGRLTVRIIK